MKRSQWLNVALVEQLSLWTLSNAQSVNWICGVSDEALGECGACNSLVPINSKSCPECGVYFVADNVLNVLKEWFINTGIDSRKLFAKFDSDSDGHIDADELKDGLLKMNLADLPPSQIDRLIAEVDTDNDGVISLDELVSAITDEPAEDSDTELILRRLQSNTPRML